MSARLVACLLFTSAATALQQLPTATRTRSISRRVPLHRMVEDMPARGEPGYKRSRLRQAARSLLRRQQSPASESPAAADTEEEEPWVSSFAAPPEGLNCEDEEECVLPDIGEDGEEEDTASDAEASDSLASEEEPAAGVRWTKEDTERLSQVELASVRAVASDPANPAEAIRAAGEGARLLDEMELACCWLHHEAASEALPLPRFRVTARPSKILEPELRQMAIVLRKALDRDEDFTILWDLRELRPPSLSALNYGNQWQGENAADIERLGKSIVVLVSSPVTRVCANLCTRVCNPPQPTQICTDETEAVAFAKAQYEKS